MTSSIQRTGDDPGLESPSKIVRVDSSQDSAARKRRLLEMVGRSEQLNDQQATCLEKFLAEHHQVFSLDPGNHGEMDLVQMEIDTGDAPPRRQPLR